MILENKASLYFCDVLFVTNSAIFLVIQTIPFQP